MHYFQYNAKQHNLNHSIEHFTIIDMTHTKKTNNRNDAQNV